MGEPLAVQNPRSLNLLMSLGRGASLTVSQAVDRRLTFFPDRLLPGVTLASPALPILRIVPRKNASSALALVMRVFSSLLFAERERERFLEEMLDFLFDLFCQLLASAKSDDPIVGISQVFESDKLCIVHYH
jgi:hypothetical protein